MSTNQSADELDDTIVEEVYTDTSMFNADQIVADMEAVSKQRKRRRKNGDKNVAARRRFEELMEEKRLREQLSDWDDEYLDA